GSEMWRSIVQWCNARAVACDTLSKVIARPARRWLVGLSGRAVAGAFFFLSSPGPRKGRWGGRRLRFSHAIPPHLCDLFDKTGLASADLARLAIRQMVENPRSVQLTPERERA